MSEIRVDTISERTSANGVTIDGLTIKDGGITATTGAIVFNEASADLDFRVESNGNANMLKVDGGNNRVGVGCDPSADFHVDSSGGGVIRVSRNSASTSNYMAIESDGTNGTVKAIQELIISAGGGEVARFTSGGLAIGGTGAANTLDDYEEGTCTLAMSDNNTSFTMASGFATGHYTKIGNRVYVHGYIKTTSINSASSNDVKVTGLPFTSNSTNNSYASVNVGYQSNLNISAGTPIGGFVNINSTQWLVTTGDTGGGTTNMTASEWNNVGEIVFSLNYITA